MFPNLVELTSDVDNPITIQPGYQESAPQMPQDIKNETVQDQPLGDSNVVEQKSGHEDEDDSSKNEQSDEKKSSRKTDTSNFTEYQRVWILICLDRARQIHAVSKEAKITSKLYRTFCEMLKEEQEITQINRKPTIKSLKNIWSTFIELKQVKRNKKGGPKPKKCRQEVEHLLRQGLSFRQIVRELRPEISISTTTVGRIAEDIKKEENKRLRALNKGKKSEDQGPAAGTSH